MRSGPTTNAVTLVQSQEIMSKSVVTTPTRPFHSGPARSTVTATSIDLLAVQAARSCLNSWSSGVREP